MVRAKTHLAPTNAMTQLVLVMHDLLAAKDARAIMMAARRHVQELLGADAVTILFRDERECHYSDDDRMAARWEGNYFPLDIFLSGLTITDKRAITIGDLHSDESVPNTIHKPSFVKSLVMAPIHSADPIGAIGCYWETIRIADQHEVALVQSIADITALAIQNLNKRAALERGLEDRIEELEEANRSLEAFNHSVSHDLRAPLRSLSGIAQMFQDVLVDKLDAEDAALASRIVGSIDHMEHLIDGLLAFSKLGRQKVTTASVSMKKVVDDICREFAADPCNTTLKFEVGSLPAIQADLVLIKQVWTNLIGNAVKYTGKRSSRVIKIDHEVHDDVVVYSVTDNGSGFDMAHADKLFKVFQRLHTQREFEGIGIGLSIVHRIVTKHGGKIWAEGKVNEGAKFSFSLPR